jgi:SNF2 family DNA or RNA helicase
MEGTLEKGRVEMRTGSGTLTKDKVKVRVLGKDDPVLVEIEVLWPPAEVLVNPMGFVSTDNGGYSLYRFKYFPPLVSLLSRLIPFASFEDSQAYCKALALEKELFPEDFLYWVFERILPFPVSQYPASLFSTGKKRLSLFSLSKEGGIFVLTPLDPYSRGETPSLSQEGVARVDLKGRIVLNEDEFANLFYDPFPFPPLGLYPLILLEPSTASEVVQALSAIYRDSLEGTPPFLKELISEEDQEWWGRLWEHQRRGIVFLLKLMTKGKTGGYLAFDMGTGKTLTSLSFARLIRSKRTLVVCPKAVIPTWEKEAKRWFPDYFDPIVPLTEGNSYYKSELVRNTSSEDSTPLVIVNYDSLIREPLSLELSSVKWDLLILDEAHFVKSHESKRFKVLQNIKSKFTVALSGTPMVQGPLDIWSQARLLDPSFLGKNFYAFRYTYAVMGGFGNKQVVGYRNQEHLSRKISKFMIKVSIDDVLELPESVSEVLEVDLEPEAKRLHDSIYSQLKEAAMEGRVGEHYAALAITRMMQITGGYFHDDERGEVRRVSYSKERALEEALSMIGAQSGEPVVVFGVFHQDLDTILEVAKRMGLSSGELSGRKNNLEGFRQGRINLLAVQIQAGGVGVDLSRSRYAIYYSVGYSLGNYLQSLARIRRPGQNRKVVYLHIVARETIDERVFEALRDKSEVISHVLETIS